MSSTLSGHFNEDNISDHNQENPVGSSSVSYKDLSTKELATNDSSTNTPMSTNDNDVGKSISMIQNDASLTSIDASALNQDESEGSATMNKSNTSRCEQLGSETLPEGQLKANSDQSHSDMNAHSAQLDNNKISKKTDQNNAKETGLVNIVKNNGEPIMVKSNTGKEPNSKIALEDKDNQTDTTFSNTGSFASLSLNWIYDLKFSQNDFYSFSHQSNS